MKPTTIEEYGLRCLLRVAQRNGKGSVAIAEIAEAEGITSANVAKLMRLLRKGGLVESVRGQSGGYKLSRPPERIAINDVLSALGGRLQESMFCERHSGIEKCCTHSFDCSIRTLWKCVQFVVDQVLDKTTVKDLIDGGASGNVWFAKLAEQARKLSPRP